MLSDVIESNYYNAVSTVLFHVLESNVSCVRLLVASWSRATKSSKRRSGQVYLTSKDQENALDKPEAQGLICTWGFDICQPCR